MTKQQAIKALEAYRKAVEQVLKKEMWPMQAAYTLKKIEEEFQKEK